MKKTINIGGTDVLFKANARTVDILLDDFGVDIIADFQKIDFQSTAGLRIVKKLAYVMAEQAHSTGDLSYEEWLESFDVFPAQAYTEIVNLWAASMDTSSVAKNG